MTYVQLATKHTKKSRQDSHCTERINLSKLDSNLLTIRYNRVDFVRAKYFKCYLDYTPNLPSVGQPTLIFGIRVGE